MPTLILPSGRVDGHLAQRGHETTGLATRGTDGSNPPPSSGESAANRGSSRRHLILGGRRPIRESPDCWLMPHISPNLRRRSETAPGAPDRCPTMRSPRLGGPKRAGQPTGGTKV